MITDEDEILIGDSIKCQEAGTVRGQCEDAEPHRRELHKNGKISLLEVYVVKTRSEYLSSTLTSSSVNIDPG